MAFVRLPGANLNTAPLQLHPYIAPARPVFPTYEVVMNALHDILPALQSRLDPVERAKRQLALGQLSLAEQSLPLEQKKLLLEQKMMEQQSKLYDSMGSGGGGLPAGVKMVGGKLTPWDQNDWDKHNKAKAAFAAVHHGTDIYAMQHEAAPNGTVEPQAAAAPIKIVAPQNTQPANSLAGFGNAPNFDLATPAPYDFNQILGTEIPPDNQLNDIQ